MAVSTEWHGRLHNVPASDVVREGSDLGLIPDVGVSE